MCVSLKCTFYSTKYSTVNVPYEQEANTAGNVRSKDSRDVSAQYDIK